MVKENKTAEVITSLEKMAEYGAMLTPAVAIDGKIRIEGKVPTENELEKIIK